MGLRNLLARSSSERALSVTDWAKMFQPGASFTFQGQQYRSYKINDGPYSAASSYYDSNSVVFACATNRILLFSEARFQFQQIRNGRPGDLFGNDTLSTLEEPWPGATTRDLLVQAELDVLLAGNSYWVNDGPYLVRLEPEKMSILTTRGVDDNTGYKVGERVALYVYAADDKTTVSYLPTEVAHYKPHPSRNNRCVGMSWLSPCLPDIDADDSMTEHKRVQLKSGANLSYVVSMPSGLTLEAFRGFVKEFQDRHDGPQNAGKTLFLGGGADVKTVGQTFENLNFKATQGAGETRIAACAGVPPVIVGLSEGLASATYSNYGQARRRLVDGTMRPLWGFVAGAMESVVAPPRGSRLWYDDRDIPFLREDVLDQAEIRSRNALTMESLIRAGYAPESVRDAVTSDDFRLLKHTGLFSVQLQPPQPGQLDTDS